MDKFFGDRPGYRYPLTLFRKVLLKLHIYLDGQFDRAYGTDTSGIIPLSDLNIGNRNIQDCHWYAPMSIKVFRRIMDCLAIDFRRFDFVDFGSGKGRVLLLASQYGFKKIIGVEFAPELHHIAAQNVKIWESRSQKPSGIETVCMDAVQFPIVNEPMVVFLYSPFVGSVLQSVLDNLTGSLARHSRDVVLIFYGANPESIRLLEATGLMCQELKLRLDWSHFTHYRALIFSNVKCKK
jgi:SAM-dependent methyltransferase